MRVGISKTWKFGPFNFTVGKSGVSASVGIPGARVGLNSKGQVTTRIGKKGLAYTKTKKIV